jgi:hypothetical protein
MRRLRLLHQVTIALGALALIGCAYIASQEACSWGILQHAGTIGISALIGMAMSAALNGLDRA